MKNPRFFSVLMTSWILSFPAWPAPVQLPALGLDASSITVSGLSSGAFMAVQLGVAHSSVFKGVGIIAGGIYGCAENSEKIATDLCMAHPENIDAAKYVQRARDHFQKNLIDDPANLSAQKVFILNGREDKTVLPAAGPKLESFYQAFGSSIVTEYGLAMGHAFPSEKASNPCDVSRFPWINRCGYEGARKILETFYGPLSKPAGKVTEPVMAFNQEEFHGIEAAMLEEGNVFIPAPCKDPGAHCRLHIALHGCLQNPRLVKNAFFENAGFNEWAETNKMVILYPAVALSPKNPNGCWDWYGYTGPDYAVKTAAQMKVIIEMITRLTAANSTTMN
jgi:poly(3-hydroxybutyrate) depolymerase